eukprot:Gb_39253 [translate_table: standard]
MGLNYPSEGACMIILDEIATNVNCMELHVHACDICGCACMLHMWEMGIPNICVRSLTAIGGALSSVNQMDSTERSKEKAHENVKLEPYGMSLKKVFVVPNERGVPVEEVKHQQGIQIKRRDCIVGVRESKSGTSKTFSLKGWRTHEYAGTILTRWERPTKLSKGDNYCYILMKP